MRFLILEEQMKIIDSFRDLNNFEKCLLAGSVTPVILSYVIFPGGDLLSLIASLIGATALIFVAKGYVLGQILTVVFALFYGVISFSFRYYGEMITYLGMTSPMAILATVSWIRNPYKETREVKVSRMTKGKTLLMLILSAVVTAVFYFILRTLGNESLVVSTVSVTTSFLASYLTFMRSPYYALAYAANDVVLIVLWVIASISDVSFVPMVVCFSMFFINDMYGFVNWQRMRSRQAG